MKNRIKQICAIMLMLLGSLHIAYAFSEYKELTSDYLWFISGGLCFIFLGAFHLSETWSKENLTSLNYLLLAVDLVFIVFLSFMLTLMPMLPGFLGLGATLVLLILSLSNRSQKKNAIRGS